MIESKTFLVDNDFNVIKLVNNLTLYINTNKKIVCKWNEIQNGYFIQIFPKHKIKKLFGFESCLNIHISKIKNRLILNIGIGNKIKESSPYLSEITPCFNILEWNNKPTVKKILLFVQNYVSTNVNVNNINTEMSIISTNSCEIKCINCNYTNPKNSMFCLNCGNKLHIECKDCGTLLQLPSKICPKCGKEN